MTSKGYVTNAIQNLRDTLAGDGAQPLKIFVNKAGERPFPSNYCPELGVSPVSDDASMSQYLQLIGVLRYKADPDVWLKAEMKSCGTEYYEYVLVYVDDVLHLHQYPDTFMNA